MPFVNIQTNIPDKEISDEFLKKISAATATLTKKPEGFVAVKASGDERLIWGGSSAPAAMVEFVSIGLKATETKEISGELMTLIEEHLKIAADRVYIRFFDPPGPMIGWNKDVF